MGRKTKAAVSQKTITSAGFFPMLPKPAVAVGKFSSVPGKYWSGCPPADKDKRFKCTVVDFVALHDFGDGFKGAGFQLKEMGEDGRGSLEPGVASGDVFIMAYPLPFLEYYYFENRAELTVQTRNILFPGDAAVAATVDADGAANDGAAAVNGTTSLVKQVGVGVGAGVG
jgi:hypothetical protein